MLSQRKKMGALGKEKTKAPFFERSWVLVAPIAFLLVGFYLLPLFETLWMSISVPELGVGNYKQLVINSSLRGVLLNTLRICFLTTLISVSLGYVLAFALARSGPRRRALMMIVLLIPFWMPVLVRAFSWLLILHDGGLLNASLIEFGIITSPLHLVRNELGVVIGMVHYMLPYAALTLFANISSIDWRLMRAGESLGASPFVCFLKIFLPLSMPGIASASILVLVLSLGFYVTPAILGGGKTIMIAEFVSIQILQTSKWGLGTMMSTVLLVAILSLLLISARFVKLKSIYGNP